MTNTLLLEKPRAFDTLRNLLGSTSFETFLERYWEKDYLHIEEGPENRFDSLFSLSDVDRWLETTHGGAATSVLLTPPGGSKDTSDNTKGRPEDFTAREIYSKLAEGWSVVLNRLEDRWAPLRPTIEALAKAFSAQIGANVYLTPHQSQTFEVHIDNHDVFVLQISGTKVWRLYEMSELPIVRMNWRDHLDFPDWWSKLDQKPLLRELTLQPGDVLYVPRGMPHCAVTRDSASLHITLSVNPLYWTDFFKAALEQTCFEAGRLRHALPPGFVEDEASHSAMKEHFQAALQEFVENVSFEETLLAVRRERVAIHGFPADGHIRQIVDLEQLALETRVERRPGILCFVEKHEEYGKATLRFGTEKIRGKIGLFTAFEFVSKESSFRVSDLPRLDDQSKLVLARRLIKEGCLRVVST